MFTSPAALSNEGSPSDANDNEENVQDAWPFANIPNSTWSSTNNYMADSTSLPPDSGNSFAFGSGSSYNSPDTLFTAMPFDRSQDPSGLLSGFEMENFNMSPSDYYDVAEQYTDLSLTDPAFSFDFDVWSTSQVNHAGCNRQALTAAEVLSPVDNGILISETKAARKAKIPSRPSARRKLSAKTGTLRQSSQSSAVSSPFSTASSSKDNDRQNHNQIEKRYRTSINDRFDVLKASLPDSMLGKSDGAEGAKKSGKSEVLVGALKYVKELEEQSRILSEEKTGLIGSIGVWEKQWAATEGRRTTP